MQQDPKVLRDQAARPTLRRLRADLKRVSIVLKPALEVIESRIFDPELDVNTLWRESGLSKEKSALFAAELEATPGVYIVSRRLEIAAELLAGTELKVYEVGMLVGYSAGNDTFSRAFRRWSGMSPSDFRDAARSGGEGAETAAQIPEREVLLSLVDHAGLASAAGDFEGALGDLSKAKAILKDHEIQDLTARLGLARHERGAERTRDGDVDRAFDDLALARDCFRAAGELSPDVLRRRRHLAVSYDTDEALLSALCPDCRTTLAGDQGRTLRQDLRRALRPVPRDLPWFESCCDDCYRVVWKAISRARAGLMDDAWKAWWLSANADLEDRETPPSRGRFIAALAEVERLVTGNQLERKGYCDLAVDDAVALGDSLLETQARIWRGSVLRAMGELLEARVELRDTNEASKASPWLSALHCRMVGILERDATHLQKGVDLLQSAASRYRDLDCHISGLLLVAQAIAHYLLTEYTEAVSCNRAALSLLDSRRDPLPANGVVPVNLAGYYAQMGDLENAESTLAQCRFDREAHPGLAALEMLHRACLALRHGRPQESLHYFSDVKDRFERLDQPLDVAVVALYSSEAHARLGDHTRAVESAVAALRFFDTARCGKDTLEAVTRLCSLLEREQVDLIAVTSGVRSLARIHGGWLPEPE